MTPKEKAFELAHKFRLIDIRTSESTTMMISMADAKQCALIAVDEIIDNWKSEATIQYPYGKVINYWNVVKIEIEKL
jgi:hypothetical protein